MNMNMNINYPGLVKFSRDFCSTLVLSDCLSYSFSVSVSVRSIVTDFLVFCRETQQKKREGKKCKAFNHSTSTNPHKHTFNMSYV